MNDRSWIVNDCSQTAACAGQFLLPGTYIISWLPYRLGSFGSDLIHTSIQLDSVETNLANEIVLPAYRATYFPHQRAGPHLAQSLEHLWIGANFFK